MIDLMPTKRETSPAPMTKKRKVTKSRTGDPLWSFGVSLQVKVSHCGATSATHFHNLPDLCFSPCFSQVAFLI